MDCIAGLRRGQPAGGRRSVDPCLRPKRYVSVVPCTSYLYLCFPGFLGIIYGLLMRVKGGSRIYDHVMFLEDKMSFVLYDDLPIT